MEERKTTGLIMLKNKLGIEHKIAKIEYTVYEDDSFEYVFTPYYCVIDLLTSDLFQGIPGLDLDLRLETYVRKDSVPVFISERTPSPARENLDDLLAEAGMKYLNPLEWLIKTNYIYSGDRFYVVEYNESYEDDFILQTGISAISAVRYAEQVVGCIAHGRKIILNGKTLQIRETECIYTILLDLLSSNKEMNKKNRQAGIDKAASNGLYKGRKKIRLDEIQFETIKEAYLNKEIGVDEAIKKLGISRATFYRRLKCL